MLERTSELLTTETEHSTDVGKLNHGDICFTMINVLFFKLFKGFHRFSSTEMSGLLLGVVLIITSVQAMKYVEEPSNTSVAIDGDVILRCKVYNKDTLLYWQKLDGKTGYKFISMDGNVDPYGVYSTDIKSRYSIIGNHDLGEYHLRIERVNIDDAGRYACVYFDDDKFGRYASIAHLTVMWPAPEPPQCQHTYSASSQRVSLTCISRGGKPLASLAWENGKQHLKGTARQTKDISLNIYQPGSRKFTESTFACVATTPALANRRVCRVLPVYITWRPNNLYTGDEVILTCNMFGNEHDLAISWQINDKPATNSGKLTEFRDGNRKLIIYDLNLSDNELKVMCIVQNRNGLRGNATEKLVIYNKENVDFKPTQTTTQTTLMSTTLTKDSNGLTTRTHGVLTNRPNSEVNILAAVTEPRPSLQPLTDKYNISAIEGTVMYDNRVPGPPLEVGIDWNGSVFYKSFMAIICLITFLLFILVIVYGTRYRRSKKQTRREKQRQLDEKCKDSVPMAADMNDLASESKRSDNEDSGISYSTEIESSVDCNTIDYKQRILGTYPDLIMNQDRKIMDDKKEEPIYMSLNNCSDGESEDEVNQQNVKNNKAVYMVLDREAERRDEVYSCVEIGTNGNSNPHEINGTKVHKHLYAVLENDTENNCIESDLRKSDICTSGYYSADSPCEYEELPDTMPVRNKCLEPPCAYAVTDLRQTDRPLRQSLKQTLWRKLTRSNNNTLKENKEHIARRSLPKPSRNAQVTRENPHNALVKTNSCPLVVPMVAEGSRGPTTDSLIKLRNAHFMANRPLVSRPIFGQTLSTENGIVVTDDYAELEIIPSFSENQRDDTYESLDEYSVVKSPAKNKPQRVNGSPVLKLSPSFHGRELPKLRKSVSCHRCSSPKDRGFYSSSSEEEVTNSTGPQTPPRILKNYKRIDQIRRDEARLKRASWPNPMAPRIEKRFKKTNAYSVVEMD